MKKSMVFFIYLSLIFISALCVPSVMKIFIEKDRSEKEIEFSGNVEAMLEKIGENPVAVLVTRDGELLSEDDTLENSDEVKVLSVVSGG